MSFKKRSVFGRYKAPIIVCTGALLTGLISFFVTVNVYDNSLENDLKDNLPNKVVSSLSGEKNIDVAINNDNKKEEKPNNEVISQGGESTKEEYVGEEINVPEITGEDYENFVSLIAQNNDENIEEAVIETNANVQKESGENEKIEISFMYPVSGEIGLNYATETLVYSNTLEEWITHNGIDIIGEEAEPVKAIGAGMVESIKMDPRYGNTIIIKHDDEYKSVYSNLSTTDLVYVGKKVEKGEIISGIGKGFGFESKEEPHIHLTILKNGESVNPDEVIN